MASDAENFPIRKWTLCYYLDKDRTWIYGDLSICINGVTFQSSLDAKANVQFKLYYKELADVKKTTTGLIFGALVLVLSNGTKHWFSSIPDREGLFNCINYFWKAGLMLEQKDSKNAGKKSNRTEMGRQLLKLAHDSDKTLRGAADSLSVQGAQIDSAFGTMFDIHNDLDVADSMVSGLEAWLGKWKMPTEYKYVEPVIVSGDDLPDMLEYEILYTKLQVGKFSTQNVGILRVSKDGLFILTDKQKLVHQFKWMDISQVKVVTLWEIVVTRFLIGQSDLSYSVISSGLIKLLKLLDKRLKNKMEYSRDVFDQVTSERTQKVVKQSHISAASEREQLHRKEDNSFFKRHTKEGEVNVIDVPTQPIGLQQNVQINQSAKVVSDEEVEELSQVLGNLKHLALSVGQETDSQNEKIDALTSSVNKANLKIHETEKRVKDLL